MNIDLSINKTSQNDLFTLNIDLRNAIKGAEKDMKLTRRNRNLINDAIKKVLNIFKDYIN